MKNTHIKSQALFNAMLALAVMNTINGWVERFLRVFSSKPLPVKKADNGYVFFYLFNSPIEGVYVEGTKNNANGHISLSAKIEWDRVSAYRRKNGKGIGVAESRREDIFLGMDVQRALYYAYDSLGIDHYGWPVVANVFENAETEVTPEETKEPPLNIHSVEVSEEMKR